MKPDLPVYRGTSKQITATSPKLNNIAPNAFGELRYATPAIAIKIPANTDFQIKEKVFFVFIVSKISKTLTKYAKVLLVIILL